MIFFPNIKKCNWGPEKKISNLFIVFLGWFVGWRFEDTVHQNPYSICFYPQQKKMHLRSSKKISNLFTFLFLWGDLWVEDLKVQFMKTLITKVFFYQEKKISPPKVQEKSQTSSPFFFLVGFVGWRFEGTVYEDPYYKGFFLPGKKISPPKVQEKSQTSSPFFFLVGFVGWRFEGTVYEDPYYKGFFLPGKKNKPT